MDVSLKQQGPCTRSTALSGSRATSGEQNADVEWENVPEVQLPSRHRSSQPSLAACWSRHSLHRPGVVVVLCQTSGRCLSLLSLMTTRKAFSELGGVAVCCYVVFLRSSSASSASPCRLGTNCSCRSHQNGKAEGHTHTHKLLLRSSVRCTPEHTESQCSHISADFCVFSTWSDIFFYQNIIQQNYTE